MTPDGRRLVLVMAGGTGGHVFPALAVARELAARGLQVEWVGTRRGLEQRVVPAAGFALHHLSVRGVRGKGLADRTLALVSLGVACVQALRLVLQRKPACVVGMGGYAAGPGGVAAWLCRRPLLIHEQNAVAGTTNRLLAPLASAVIEGFAGAFAGDRGAQVLGNPVRAELLAAAAGARYDYAGDRPLRLLVLGGSLGAQPINEAVPAALARLCAGDAPARLEILHQAGAGHAESTAAAYAGRSGATVRVVPFIEDMAAAYAWADLVVCRAGALTVAELAIMGRPAILVPLPHAIDDHQTVNAHALVDCGGALLLRQADMHAESLAAILDAYIRHPARLQSMARAAQAAARPEATRRVADAVEGLLHAA